MSEIFKVSGKKFSLKDGGKKWNFSVRSGGWVIAESSNGERTRLFLAESRGKLSASLGGKLYQGEISQDRSSSGIASRSDADLTAQFPGKIRKVLVTSGVSVKEGDPLILVEAMKMEFTIKAPFDGKVSRILVKEGQQLSPGDRFLDFEAGTDG